MKKNILMIAVLALSALSMVSCKKDKISENENGMTTIFARMDSPKAGGEKTHLGPLGEDGITPTHWSANDKVAVFEGTTKYEYTLSGDGGSSEASFTGPVLATGASHCAFYPYDESENLNATTSGGSFTVNFDLPQIQTYKEGSFNEGTCPMVAYSNDEKFSFLNMTGVLKLHIEGTGIVGKIVVTSTTNEALWGSASVTVDATTTEPKMTITNSDSYKNQLFLNCPDGVDISEGKDFYFVLPAGVLSNGFYVDVYNIYTSTRIDRSAVHGEIIKRSIISRMQITEVSVPVEDPLLLPGKFTIPGMSQQVQFSKGNLYCSANGNSWNFEDNQYDYRSYGGREACINGNITTNGTPEGTQGLFCWSNTEHMYGLNPCADPYQYGTYYGWENAKFENPSSLGWCSLNRKEMIDMLNKYTKGLATVENVKGLIVLPSSANLPYDFTETFDDYQTNNYSGLQWFKMTEAGAVFFPAAGYGTYKATSCQMVSGDVANSGNYWCPDDKENTSTMSKKMYFKIPTSTGSSAYGTTSYKTSNACSVRLVKKVNE